MGKQPTPLATLGAAILGVLRSSEASASPVPKALARSLPDATPNAGDGNLLLKAPRLHHPLFADHRSHASHSSHYSGSGGGGSYAPTRTRRSGSSYGGGYGDDSVETPAPAPRPPPIRPAHVSLVAYPGGAIYVDGRLVGHDATRTLTLQPGSHEIRIVNAYVGDHNQVLVIADGQTGVVVVEW